MKHYYKEMLIIADELVKLGFHIKNDGEFYLNDVDIQISINRFRVSIFTDYPTTCLQLDYSDNSTDHIIKKIKEFLPKPHWEVDGCFLMYNMCGLNHAQYNFLRHNDIFDDFETYMPTQFIGKESDFTILYKDGSVKYAKWIK